MNNAIHAASTKQALVCSIDDHINVKLDDACASNFKFEYRHADRI